MRPSALPETPLLPLPAGPSCPVGPDLTDATAGRIGALLSLGLVLLAAWRGWGGLALALAADFALRALGRSALSPVARAAGLIRRLAGLPGKPVNAAPKRFAAALGGVCALGAGLALLAGFRGLGLAWAAVLGTCAGLEAAFGFCVACRIHPWLPRRPARARH